MLQSKAFLLRDTGAYCAQGSRPYNEDRYATVLPGQFKAETGDNLAFFAVYNGHGSHVIAEHAAENLHKLLMQNPKLRDREYEDVIKEALAKEDHILLRDYHRGSEEYALSGSTVALCLVDFTHGILTAGNLGDSHAILAEYDAEMHSGRSFNIERLTKGHDPTKPSERERIEEAGGEVHKKRVGNLNMSRTLGDLQYKNPTNQCNDDTLFPARRRTTAAIPEDRGDFLSSEPYVTSRLLEPGRHYVLILVTDGVTHYMNDKRIVEKTLELAEEGRKAQEITERIVLLSVDHPKSDNATCVNAFLEC